MPVPQRTPPTPPNRKDGAGATTRHPFDQSPNDTAHSERIPYHIRITQRNKMPVPKRRKSQGASSLMALPSYTLRLFDIDYVFSKTRFLLLWGFAPTVVLIGMMTEPTPSSWFDIINLLE